MLSTPNIFCIIQQSSTLLLCVFTNIKTLFSNDATSKDYTSTKFCSNMNQGIAKFMACSDSQLCQEVLGFN